jgi:hypothetical protein
MVKFRPPIIILLLLSYCIVIFINCGKKDVPPPKTGSVKGRALDEYNKLLTGVILNIQGNGVNSSTTSPDGNYEFNTIKVGSYNLSVKKDGYIESSATISIIADVTLDKDFILKAGTAYLNLLSDSIITMRASGGTFVIKVGSNTNWTINNTNAWIVPATQNSSGDESVEVTIRTTPFDTLRQATFSIQAGSLIRNIVVKQLPKISLTKAFALPGNLVKGITDSIALLFNQPVTIKNIIPGNTFCQSSINYTYWGDNKITFSYACGALGGDYPFTVTASNSYGDQFIQTITIGFYENAIHLTGTIQSYFVNDADNSYWIITDNPNVLYKIDMTSFQILQTYPLSTTPVMFTINPYNNKIYLAYAGIPKLYIMSQNGTTDNVIDIIHDTTRTQYEFGGPRIYPVKLAFAGNGKGLIWLSDSHPYSYTGFWFIDAANDHRIWYESLPGEQVNYLDAKVNYNKTKLILTYMNDDPTIGTFDAEQMKFSSYRPTQRTRGVFISPSRKNGNVYSGQLYNQLIVNPETGFESEESFKDNRNFGNVDFSYKPGRDQTIYFTEQGYIEVLDYSLRSSPVVYDAIPYLKGTTTTLDGKYVIVNRHDGNYNAKVIQLPASWFDY